VRAALHFKGRKDPKKTADCTTPEHLFHELNTKLGPFDVDLAATKKNAKCRKFFTPEDDALSKDWTKFNSCFCNPPYGRGLYAWVQKMSETAAGGGYVVALLPSRTDTRWFHDFVLPLIAAGSTVRFLRGRLRFGGQKNAAPFPSLVVVFGSRSKARSKRAA